jgi:hypothetical protein
MNDAVSLPRDLLMKAEKFLAGWVLASLYGLNEESTVDGGTKLKDAEPDNLIFVLVDGEWVDGRTVGLEPLPRAQQTEPRCVIFRVDREFPRVLKITRLVSTRFRSSTLECSRSPIVQAQSGADGSKATQRRQ